MLREARNGGEVIFHGVVCGGKMRERKTETLTRVSLVQALNSACLLLYYDFLKITIVLNGPLESKT